MKRYLDETNKFLSHPLGLVSFGCLFFITIPVWLLGAFLQLLLGSTEEWASEYYKKTLDAQVRVRIAEFEEMKKNDPSLTAEQYMKYKAEEIPDSYTYNQTTTSNVNEINNNPH